MRIYNATPHPIRILTGTAFKPEIRKYVETGETETVAEIPSNGMLSAKVTTTSTEPINSIPVFSKTFTGVDALPEGYDVYIVSAMYASAARSVGMDTSKLYTVADPVYTEDGRTILGSRGICPFV